MRAGGGLGMVLDAVHRRLAVAHAFDGAVVEVDVRDLDVAGRRATELTAAGLSAAKHTFAVWC
jgi:hypothetical protein